MALLRSGLTSLSCTRDVIVKCLNARLSGCRKKFAGTLAISKISLIRNMRKTNGLMRSFLCSSCFSSCIKTSLSLPCPPDRLPTFRRPQEPEWNHTQHVSFALLPGKKSYFVLWLFSLVIVVSDRFSPTHLGGKHEKMALFRTYACGAEIYICIYIHKNIFRLRICPAIQRVKLRMKEMSCWHLKHLNSIFCCHNTFA